MSPVCAELRGSLIGGVMLCFVLSACRPALPTPVEHKSEPVVDMSSKVQTLHRQIQERDKIIEERDKRIEELESQLDALKLIDQDREKHRKPPRPPTTLEPLQ